MKLLTKGLERYDDNLCFFMQEDFTEQEIEDETQEIIENQQSLDADEEIEKEKDFLNFR